MKAILALAVAALTSLASGYSFVPRSALSKAFTPVMSRRNAMVSISPLLLTPAVALASNGTASDSEPGIDYATYFGPFSCEFWGLKRLPGSNQCAEKGDDRPGLTGFKAFAPK